MKITLQLLEEHDACEEHLELFEATFGNSATFNKRNWNKAKKAGLQLGWMACLLTGEFRAEYKAKMKTITDEYNAKRKTIQAEYNAKRKTIQAEYNAKRKTIQAEYNAKMKTILFDALVKQFKAEGKQNGN
jgi:hypothetical protein